MIIHQIWFQGTDRIPKEYVPMIESWKAANPTLEHRIWDEQSVGELIRDEYPSHFDEWTRLDSLIKQCDAAKYFVLHAHGGVYADLDTRAHAGIREMLTDLGLEDANVILSEESRSATSWKGRLTDETFGQRSVVSNAVMISRRGQAFWTDFLKRAFALKHKPVLESFSTWHLTAFLESRQGKWGKIAVLPEAYLVADVKNDQSYVTHHYAGSWLDHSKSRPWEV